MVMLQGSSAAASASSEIILKTFNIILPEIIPGLHFDEAYIFRTRVSDSVQGSFGDVYGLLRFKHKRFIIKSYLCRAINDIPVFGPAPVPLQAQTFVGENDYFLAFVSIVIRQDFIIAPGAVLFAFRFFKSRFIDLNILLNHAVAREILFNMAAAVGPVNIIYMCSGLYGLIHCFY